MFFNSSYRIDLATMDTARQPRNAERILSEEFIIARSKILELAATLDRMDVAPGDVTQSAHKSLLDQGLAILCDDQLDKARRVQLLMSREYDPNWRANLAVDAGRNS